MIGGVESDPDHYAWFEEFYGCHDSDVLSFHDIRRPVLGLESSDIPIFKCSNLELTATCFGRCPLRKIHTGVTDLDTNRLANGDLFDDWGVRLVAALKPLYVLYEMAPPNSGSYKSHAYVTQKLLKLDYLASDFERLPCDLTGARTSRFRWINVGVRQGPGDISCAPSLACSPSRCHSTTVSSRRSYARNGALESGALTKRLPPRLATNFTLVPSSSASSLIMTVILIALLTKDATFTAWIYEENPSEYGYLKEAQHEKEAKQAPTRKQEAKAAKAADAKAAGEIASSGVEAKLQSIITMFEALQKTQQDTQAKLVAFETRKAAVENEEKKTKAANRARYEAKVAALAKKQSVHQDDAGLIGYESISDGEAP